MYSVSIYREDRRTRQASTHEHVVQVEQPVVLALEEVRQRLHVDTGRRDVSAHAIDHQAQERERDLRPEFRCAVNVREGLRRLIALLRHETRQWSFE